MPKKKSTAGKKSPRSVPGGRCLAYERLLLASQPAEHRRMALAIYDPSLADMHARLLAIREAAKLQQIQSRLGRFQTRVAADATRLLNS